MLSKLATVKALKHNAYIDKGSRGIVVLNQEMKIIGINIGGGTNVFNKFVYGAVVPCELISEFFTDNNFSAK